MIEHANIKKIISEASKKYQEIFNPDTVTLLGGSAFDALNASEAMAAALAASKIAEASEPGRHIAAVRATEQAFKSSLARVAPNYPEKYNAYVDFLDKVISDIAPERGPGR
jgi:hypothetical protein